MRWSVFDPKNASTLDEVRQKFGVSSDRLKELQEALFAAKKKMSGAREHNLQLTEGLLPLTVGAAKSLSTHSRREILQVFNQSLIKSQLKTLMHDGVSVAFVGDVSIRYGAKKVYKLDTDHTGRIKIALAIPENPKEVSGVGLFSVTIVDKSSTFAGKVQKFKKRTSFAQKTVAGQKSRKPRVHLHAPIKA